MSIGISENSNQRFTYSVNKQRQEMPLTASEEKPISFSKEVKDYEDKMLTGMTEEEWEKLKELCKKYQQEKPIKSKEDMLAFETFVKDLLRSFGFKGDFDGYCDLLTTETEEENKNSESTNNTSEQMKVAASGTQVITEADGTKYLLITTETGLTFKLKLGDEASQNDNEKNNVEEKKENVSDMIENEKAGSLASRIKKAVNPERAVASYDKNFVLLDNTNDL